MKKKVFWGLLLTVLCMVLLTGCGKNPKSVVGKFCDGMKTLDYAKMNECLLNPDNQVSMNQNKGTNALISDRWDLTLECIRRYYNGEESPLHDTIRGDRDFFDLFVDFKGYVDFFFLQDCVSEDYSTVDIWCGNTDFVEPGLPKTVEEYFDFIDKEFIFLNKRNQRIAEQGI